MEIPFLNATRTYHFQIVLGYLFIVWANDTFAYLTGKTMGKHALFKRISPGKTWEGSLGGLIGSLGVAAVLSLYFSTLLINQWLIIAVIIVVTGTYGDLIKSLMKRSLNIKDSGNILPGHGGMLDRFDSLLGSAPFVFLYLMIHVDA
jgi:phosphatidate cytidylyltransferase